MNRSEIDKLNPWTKLPEVADFVLPRDAPYVQAYNAAERRKQEDRIHLEVLPQPFVGSPHTAKLVILTKAPVWEEESLTTLNSDLEYTRAIRCNLALAQSEFPFYLIDPAFEAMPSFQWWSSRLRELITACEARCPGEGLRRVASGLLLVTSYPYHVNNYTGMDVTVPSQGYSFGLIGMLAEEQIPLIIISGRDEWKKESRTVREKAIFGRNQRDGSINPKNLPLGVFDDLVQRLTAD